MRKIILFFGTVCILWISNVFAAERATDELVQLLYNTHTMQANFTQTTTTQRGATSKEKIYGTMCVARPGKFRWETISPEQQLIIINDKKMLLYDPGLEQLMKSTIDYNNPGNPALLLSSSPQDLVKFFTITKPQTKIAAKNIICFKLQPKNKKKQGLGYQWIKLCFRDNIITMMQIIDNLEQKSTINFSGVVTNIKITQQKFVFTPPPRTEVIERL